MFFILDLVSIQLLVVFMKFAYRRSYHICAAKIIYVRKNCRGVPIVDMIHMAWLPPNRPGTCLSLERTGHDTATLVPAGSWVY